MRQPVKNGLIAAAAILGAAAIVLGVGFGVYGWGKHAKHATATVFEYVSSGPPYDPSHPSRLIPPSSLQVFSLQFEPPNTLRLIAQHAPLEPGQLYTFIKSGDTTEVTQPGTTIQIPWDNTGLAGAYAAFTETKYYGPLRTAPLIIT